MSIPKQQSPVVTTHNRAAIARRRPPRGFTLVELLVVVSILGLLAAIVSSAVLDFIRSARITRTGMEINQLEMAFEKLNAENGEYPPSLLFSVNGSNEVESYFNRMYRRYDTTNRLATDMETVLGQFQSGYTFSVATVAPNVNRPDWALVFWLVGFSGDPADPLRGHADRMRGITDSPKPYFEFDKDRLAEGTYARQDNTALLERRYYYVDHRNYGRSFADRNNLSVNFVAYHQGTLSGAGDPYRRDSFQIINPGRDGLLGSGGGTAAVGVPYSGDDADNITNFSNNKSMYDFSNP
ncbi:MAG: prepilin-type N-terminal cleavage/methylation domain-containing protein [Planctomycetota bacterium]|nr:MAG: prepilin-type N-terminal cleavage/methylation domain-containing protein [Planctomycetota bacterium]REJ96700.1 MAG: prepilin-type N-terminal cleavage/methylation domain-containing protein [Planctomycetota bacterium]